MCKRRIGNNQGNEIFIVLVLFILLAIILGTII